MSIPYLYVEPFLTVAIITHILDIVPAITGILIIKQNTITEMSHIWYCVLCNTAAYLINIFTLFYLYQVAKSDLFKLKHVYMSAIVSLVSLSASTWAIVLHWKKCTITYEPVISHFITFIAIYAIIQMIVYILYIPVRICVNRIRFTRIP
jgi:hypothetical protein